MTAEEQKDVERNHSPHEQPRRLEMCARGVQVESCWNNLTARLEDPHLSRSEFKAMHC